MLVTRTQLALSTGPHLPYPGVARPSAAAPTVLPVVGVRACLNRNLSKPDQVIRLVQRCLEEILGPRNVLTLSAVHTASVEMLHPAQHVDFPRSLSA